MAFLVPRSEWREEIRQIAERASAHMQTETQRFDPLLYAFEMPLRAVYYPIGFPLAIATNSEEVLAAAEESWGHFQNRFSYPPLEARIGVLPNGPAECPPAPTYRQQRNIRAWVADAQNFGISDPQHGFAFAWFTRAVVENRAYLRWNFLEALSWDLLGAYLTPVHAACVRLADRGVLLCGDSGAGKSSLAFACAKAGWTYMADDSSHVVRGRPSSLVVGNPYQIRFRESAIDLFPELRAWPATPRATGEMAIELPTANLPQIQTTSDCVVHYIVFLNRAHLGPPRLCGFPKEEALDRFEQVICCNEPEVVEAHKQALKKLLTAAVFELRYSDLTSAVQRLENLVRHGL
jgi:hypothetical protein